MESRKDISLSREVLRCYCEKERPIKKTQEVLEKTKEGQLEDSLNYPVQSSSDTIAFTSKRVTSQPGDDFIGLVLTPLHFFPQDVI